MTLSVVGVTTLKKKLTMKYATHEEMSRETAEID